MAHNIKPGVATGDQVQEVFNYAKEKGFAIPAVNVTSALCATVTPSAVAV